MQLKLSEILQISEYTPKTPVLCHPASYHQHKMFCNQHHQITETQCNNKPYED